MLADFKAAYLIAHGEILSEDFWEIMPLEEVIELQQRLLFLYFKAVASSYSTGVVKLIGLHSTSMQGTC